MTENRKTPKLRFKGFTDAWEQRKLGEVLRTIPFKPFLKIPEQGGKYEIIQQGNEPIIGYANGEPCEDFRNTVIFGDHTLSLYKPKQPFFVATDGVRILQGTNDMYGYYLLSLLEGNSPQSEGYKRYYSILADREVLFTENHYEQVKIGLYFKNLDNLITLHQHKLDRLKNIKKSMLDKMFPKDGEVVPEIRFKGFTDAWEQRKLGDVVEICSGRDYKHLSEGKIPVYGTGGYMLSVSEALSYDKDAIGIGRKGTIDNPYILKAPFWTVDTLFFAIPLENKDLNFIFDLFQNVDWKKKDESTGVPSLTRTVINDIDFLEPRYKEQQVIGEFFSRFDNLITLHQRKLDKLKNIKKSMLDNMFV